MRRLLSPLWIPVLLGLAAFAPFVDALSCSSFALTADFWIPAQRPLCRGGIILSLVLLGTAGLLFAWLLYDRKPSGQPLVVTSGQGIAGLLAVGIACAIFAGYILAFTLSANRALLSADQDVTNVSTAIQRTHMGDMLPTPYVAAGSSRSFLAHHFSPSLLLYVPFYRVAALFDSDHDVYNLGLALTLIGGLLLWIYFAYRSTTRDALLLPLFVVPFTHTFLLMRQVLSFHFEVLTLPIFALLLLSIRLHGRSDVPARARWLGRLWPLFACLYLGIKEDMGAYLALYSGVFLLGELYEAWKSIRSGGSALHALSHPAALVRTLLPVARRSIYLRLAILSVVWLAGAMLLRVWLAGAGAPGWESYWNAANYPPFRKTPYTYLLVLLSSGFWIFFSARSTVVVLGVMALHMISGMPWHALFESHYSYTLLPFLFAGVVRGFMNIQARASRGLAHPLFALFLFGGAMTADYALLREKNHPYPLLTAHPAYSRLRELLQQVPAGACVQSSFHLSAIVPLRARPLPFTYYEGSAWSSILPGACLLNGFEAARMKDECSGFYRLLLERPSGCLGDEMEQHGEYLNPTENGPVLWRFRE